VYIADKKNGRLDHKMDHLACFMAGTLALGVHRGAVKGANAKRHLDAAKGLTDTCTAMYTTQATGIAPEFVKFTPQGMVVGHPAYHLRPEAVEALFYLYRITGDNKYREDGWKIFTAVRERCRLANGYTGLSDVRNPKSFQNKQETFFLAETLKYLYLLFGDKELISIEKYTFNTEAHPLSNWNEDE
jgi:mannosyl-oligosaccharide alpha-1,2-mannosidase